MTEYGQGTKAKTNFIARSMNPFKCEQCDKLILSSSCADLMQYFSEPNLQYQLRSKPILRSLRRKEKRGYQSSNHAQWLHKHRSKDD